MKIKYIIYDWDGTLCDSVSGSFEATCRIFESCGLSRPTFAEYISNLAPPFVNFYHERGVTLSGDEIWKKFLDHVRNHDNDGVFADVVTELNWQKGRGCGIFLVTSQKQAIIEMLTEKHRLRHLFDHVVPDAVPDKAVHFKAVCAMSNADPESVCSVGDTVDDIVKAIVAGIKPIAMARDPSVSDVLSRAGAHTVIGSLAELREFIH